MDNACYIPLPDRAVFTLEGKDARSFLQGIITQDIHCLTPEHAIYTLLLTPQGKFLFDFFLVVYDDKIWLDANAQRKEELLKRLMMYKLRSDVTITDVSNEYEVAALLGDRVFSNDLPEERGSTYPFCKGVAYVDPRNTALYARAIIARDNHYQSFEAKDFQLGQHIDYEVLRIANTVPDGSHDMIPDKSFPLQYRMDQLHAISFDKGCYVGQEVTTRTKHRGVVRKSVFSVIGKQDLPEAGAPIFLQEKKIGEMRSSLGTEGIALLEVESAQPNTTFISNEVSLFLK